MRYFLLVLIVSTAHAGPYNRNEWKHWIDSDDDCQDTREEILIRDSMIPVTLKNNGCKVDKGLWVGQYTGKVFTTPRNKLDMEHIVPLKWAHEHGGENWSPLLKQVFANDPENLIPVDRGKNRSKGHKGPNVWMPPKNQCLYLDQWRSITGRYNLEFDEAGLVCED